MKRYGLVYDTSLHQRVMDENEYGEYLTLDDVEAWALKLKATVEGMEHEDGCAANKCMVCGCSVATDTNHYFGSLPSHNPASGDCTCPRGEALRLLGEVL